MVDGLSATLSHNPLLALVTLFGAGLITSLTPCIYPMIPITAGILSGATADQPSRGRTARLTLAYATGLALFYAILGLIAGVSGLGGGSYPAVFLLGATSGIVAAPCGAPAFAAVLTWVATTRSGVLGFVYLFVFSLGMTALLVAVGLFSGTVAALPRAGSWMVWVRKLSGVVLLGMAEYYFIQMGKVL